MMRDHGTREFVLTLAAILLTGIGISLITWIGMGGPCQ